MLRTPPSLRRPRALARSLPGLCALALFTLAASTCAAATYYVSPSGNDNNAGTQAAPFKTIQEALNNAATGDTVSLATGTYTGPNNVDLDTKGNSVTVTSQSGAASTIINCGGNGLSKPVTTHRAFYVHTNEANVVINGLTITNAYENGSGAVAVESGATLTVTDCIFSSNSDPGSGAVSSAGTVTLTGCAISGTTGSGLYNNGTATVNNCLFKSNSKSGVYNMGSFSVSCNLTVTACTLSGNQAGGIVNTYNANATLTGCTLANNSGGGANNGFEGQLTLIGCTLTGNNSSNTGGGVSNGNALTMTGCTLKGNTAVASGGGVYQGGSGGGINESMTLTGCTFTGNTAASGGGVSVGNNSQATLVNCLLTGDKATGGNGGGVLNPGGQLTLQFCTLSRNSAQGTGAQGGGLENDGTATLTDDILYADNALTGSEIGTATTGNPVTTVTYTDIQGGLNGTGNLRADPLFVSPVKGDYHLQAGSPCLSAGTTIADVTTDLDGNTRAAPPTVGCYEGVEAAPPTPTTLALSSSANPSTTGQSVTFTAAVTGTGTAAPTGTVQFGIDGLNAGDPVSLSGGAAAYVAAGLAAGTHAITAAYGGDPANLGSAGSLTQTVNVATPLTHLLWSNTDGKAAFWTVDTSGKVLGVTSYGPFTDGSPYSVWYATALATGADGVSHLLWNNVDGKAALWDVKADGSVAGVTGYGPYTDGPGSSTWRAAGLSVGPDEVRHVLWTNPDGRAAFWGVQPDGRVSVLMGYGPFADGPNAPWAAVGLSTGPDDVSHLLWDNADGKAAFWDVSDADGSVGGVFSYGPFTDGSQGSLWGAVGLSVGPDDVSHLLWDNADGKAAFWNVGSLDGSVGGVTSYGPLTDQTPSETWAATALTTGPDGVSHLLWNNVDGRVALWTLDGSGSPSAVFGFGPYTDGAPENVWSAIALSAVAAAGP